MLHRGGSLYKGAVATVKASITMKAGAGRRGRARINGLKKKDQAERRKAKKMHKAMLSGDTLYDGLVQWVKEVRACADSLHPM